MEAMWLSGIAPRAIMRKDCSTVDWHKQAGVEGDRNRFSQSGKLLAGRAEREATGRGLLHRPSEHQYDPDRWTLPGDPGGAHAEGPHGHRSRLVST